MCKLWTRQFDIHRCLRPVVRCDFVLAVLFKPANLHSRMKEEGNVATICCVDSVADGVANGDMVALFFCGWCEDEHVEVK